MKQKRTGEETREKILTTAEDIFSRKGYFATTLDDIAAQVEIRRPSVLYYFPDKLSIFRAVLARQYTGQATQIGERKREEFADAFAYIDYLIDRAVDYYSVNPATLRIDLYNLLSEDMETVNPRELAETGVQVWRMAVKEGVAAGQFRDVPVVHLFALVQGMIGHYLLMSNSVGLIDKKLAYKTFDRRNINKMRESLRAAVWGLLKA